MSVKIINEDNKVIALLSGEIDHHNAKSLRQEDVYKRQELNFISSACFCYIY